VLFTTEECMRRFFGLRVLSIFLVAIASNCVQNTLITLAPTQFADSVTDASNSFNSGASESVFTEDDSGNDVFYVPPLVGTVFFSSPPNVTPVTCFAFHLTYLTPISFSQHLQI
jgi:hypothetical protein